MLVNSGKVLVHAVGLIASKVGCPLVYYAGEHGPRAVVDRGPWLGRVQRHRRRRGPTRAPRRTPHAARRSALTGA